MKPSPTCLKQRRCEKCNAFQVEHTSFCKCCGEFFDKGGDRWFNYDDDKFCAGGLR